MSLLELTPVFLAGLGTAVAVGALRWHSFRGRRRTVQSAADVEQAHAATLAAYVAQPVADPQPTEPIESLATAPVWPAPVEVSRELRTDLGQPVATPPPAFAPTTAVKLRPAVPPREEPIPLVPVPADAETPFAPTWTPRPADPDGWQHLPADPAEQTVCAPGPVPTPDPVALLSPTQAMERGRLYRILGNAKRAELDALRSGMENGAKR